MRVTLATCSILPEPDPDQDILMAALRHLGLDARLLPWDDPSAEFQTSDLCVIRSTWNYHLHHPMFLRWIESVSLRTRVLNPPSVIRWNSQKSYLEDLQRRGIATISTLYFNRLSQPDLAQVMADQRWPEVVVKPTISAASFATRRFSIPEAESGTRFLASMLCERDMMVQPYLRSVEGYGERAIVWIDGELTHAVRKSPRFDREHEAVTSAVPIADDERRLALSVMERLPSDLLYARIDLARSDAGQPLLMELELIEPSLFLAQCPYALNRLAIAIRTRIGNNG